MSRSITQALNPLLARVAKRLEWARLQVAKTEARCAMIDASVTLHPTAQIENIYGKPEAIVVGAHTHLRGQLLTFWSGGAIAVGKWCYLGEGSRIWSQAS